MGDFFDEIYAEYVSATCRDGSIQKQVTFIEEKVACLLKNPYILDHCCGHGRHLNYLYNKGYRIAGMDNNQTYLDLIRKSSKKEISLYHCDARDFCLNNQFDLIINMGTSLAGFEKNEIFSIINNIYNSLKTNGLFVLHQFNHHFIKENFPRKGWYTVDDKAFILEQREFNSFDEELDHMHIKHLRFIHEKEDSFKLKRQNIKLNFIQLFKLEEYLKDIGFSILNKYGDFDCQNFDYQSSPDLILVLKK